jgi:FkbM family methyltransferase
MRRLIRKMIRNAGFNRRMAPNFLEVILANKVDIVLDVGANDGGFGRELRDSGYTGHIHSFEPNPVAFKRLKNSIAGDPNWSAVQCAVGDVPGLLFLNVSEADVFSSFKKLNSFGQNSSNARVVNTVEARIVRLDDYLRENTALQGRPYLKIDTQGFEREVLEGLGNMFDKMVAIQVETSLIDSYVGEADWIDSLIYMRDHGFEVATMICNSSVPNRARVREFDIVFVRRDG